MDNRSVCVAFLSLQKIRRVLLPPVHMFFRHSANCHHDLCHLASTLYGSESRNRLCWKRHSVDRFHCMGSVPCSSGAGKVLSIPSAWKILRENRRVHNFNIKRMLGLPFHRQASSGEITLPLKRARNSEVERMA